MKPESAPIATTPESASPDPSPVELDPILTGLYASIDETRGLPLEQATVGIRAAVDAAEERYRQAEQASRRFPVPPRPATNLPAILDRWAATASGQQAALAQRGEARRATLRRELEPEARHRLDGVEEWGAGPDGAELVRLERASTSFHTLKAQVPMTAWHVIDQLGRVVQGMRSAHSNAVVLLSRIPARIEQFTLKELVGTEWVGMAPPDILAAEVRGVVTPAGLQADLAVAKRLAEEIDQQITTGTPPKYTRLERAEPESRWPTQAIR